MAAFGVWQEVGDRVFRRRHEFLDQNIGAVVCDDGVLLVDTRGSHEQASDLLDSLRELTPAAVRWVVNTHHHWDHVWGNHVVRAAPLWAHSRCRAHLLEHGEAERAEVLAWETLPADYLEQVRNVVITPPTDTFDTDHELEVGERTVYLVHPGRGHTDNDVAVHVPDAGVLFAGDLVEEGAAPNFGDSFPLDWPTSLDALIALGAGKFVPGHGDVVDPSFVLGQRAELVEIARLALTCHTGETTTRAAAAHGPYPEAVMAVALTRGIAQAKDEVGATPPSSGGS